MAIPKSLHKDVQPQIQPTPDGGYVEMYGKKYAFSAGKDAYEADRNRQAAFDQAVEYGLSVQRGLLAQKQKNTNNVLVTLSMREIIRGLLDEKPPSKTIVETNKDTGTPALRKAGVEKRIGALLIALDRATSEGEKKRIQARIDALSSQSLPTLEEKIEEEKAYYERKNAVEIEQAKRRAQEDQTTESLHEAIEARYGSTGDGA